MKIALIGYGKMGKAIEAIAIERGHEIVAKITSKEKDQIEDLIEGADAAIEFTRPEFAVENIQHCFSAKVPVVVGTTGWNEHLDAITQSCNEHDGSILHASNFSIGVNLFFEVNKKLAQLMSTQKEYHPEMQEWHHIHKLDAPSGTAITLANQIMANNEAYNEWHLGKDTTDKSIAIEAFRENEIPGTHIIKYQSDIDSIEIKHEAHNRKGFALGSVIAAEWIADKKGVYTMSDLLNL